MRSVRSPCWPHMPAAPARNLPLSDQMASALAAFCATGDPSTRRLPWDRYTAAAPRTMVFDVRSACKDSSFDDGLQAILGR